MIGWMYTISLLFVRIHVTHSDQSQRVTTYTTLLFSLTSLVTVFFARVCLPSYLHCTLFSCYLISRYNVAVFIFTRGDDLVIWPAILLDVVTIISVLVGLVVRVSARAWFWLTPRMHKLRESYNFQLDIFRETYINIKIDSVYWFNVFLVSWDYDEVLVTDLVTGHLVTDNNTGFKEGFWLCISTVRYINRTYIFYSLYWMIMFVRLFVQANKRGK